MSINISLRNNYRIHIMSYRHRWIGNDIAFTFEGEIDFDELDQANCEVYNDPRLDLMNYAIYDFTQAKCFNLTDEEIRVIAELDNCISKWNMNLRLACLGHDNNNVKDVITHYIESMKDSDWKIKCFTDHGQTISWCLE